MRYYSIIIAGAPSVFPPRYDGGAQWGTILNGYHDPNAQQIEFQIEEWTPTTPSENSTLTIHGVSWEQIKQSNGLVGCEITVLGGMTDGLPLATFQARRPKLLIQAKILKCWGNWIGTEMSIGMTFIPSGAAAAAQGDGGGGGGGGGGGNGGGGASAGAQLHEVEVMRYDRTGFRSIDRRYRQRVLGGPSVSPYLSVADVATKIVSEADIGAATTTAAGITTSFFGGGNVSPLSAPLNLVHNLMPNMPFSSGITETLSRAFPQANINMLISQGLKLGYQDAGMYQSVEQYAGYLKEISQSILGTNAYPGINISSFDRTIHVWDGSSPVSVDDINYLELIGQPTWLTVNTISVKVVLRGGLHVGSDATLPQTLMTTGPDSYLPGVQDQKKYISLPGGYKVMKILHIGDFRNPDGASWSTNYEMAVSGSVDAQNISINPPPGFVAAEPPATPAQQLRQGIAPLGTQRFLINRPGMR